MADDLERPAEPAHEDSEQHLPAPTILPFAFAGGIALILIGLIINWWLAVAGRRPRAPLRLRLDPRGDPRRPGGSRARARRRRGARLRAGGRGGGGPEEPERYPRSVFLELSTLGIGAAIGALVTVPALGFMIAPAFVGQGDDDVDLGPLDNFPEQQYVIAQFNSKKDEPQDVGRRAAFIRNNGQQNGVPSFTIISNRCAHVGCPTQPQGLPGDVEEDHDRRRAGDDHAGRERLRLPVPVPRRRLRRRGEPRRRPARPGARPLRVHDQEREPRPRQALQRRQGHRARRRREDLRVQALRPRASTSTVSSSTSGRVPPYEGGS